MWLRVRRGKKEERTVSFGSWEGGKEGDGRSRGEAELFEGKRKLVEGEGESRSCGETCSR